MTVGDTDGTQIRKVLAMATKEINVKDKTQDKKLETNLYDYLREVRTKCGIDFEDAANWRNKMIIANNQRLGIKRYSNYPYDGAPDFPLPETDKLIKKSIPNLVLSAWSPKNPVVVQVKQGYEETPVLKEKARKTSLAMNMLIRSKELDWFNKLLLAADNRKHYGHCIFKIFEQFKSRWVKKIIDLDDFPKLMMKDIKALRNSELKQLIAERYDFNLDDEEDVEEIDKIIKQFRDGKTIIECYKEEIKSLPQVEVVLPTRLSVPGYTTDINNSVRLREIFFLAEHQILALMNDEVFLKKDLEDVPKYSGGDTDMIET